MEQKTLTRNESANLVKDTWSTMVENAPKLTNLARELGGKAYIERMANKAQLHKDHYDWLVAMLNNKRALDDADRFAASARKAADPTRPTFVDSDGEIKLVFWRG